MKVILQQDIKALGKKGDLANVSDGYARNYLLPRKLAVEAGPQAMAEYVNRENAKKHKEEREREQAEQIASRIHEQNVKVTAKAGASGKLFGSVTAKEVAEAIVKAFDVEIDRKKVSLESDIKAFGTYTADVKLYMGVQARVYVVVTEE